jgi:glycosyltransferase involved in cell wall biosynthesis
MKLQLKRIIPISIFSCFLFIIKLSDYIISIEAFGNFGKSQLIDHELAWFAPFYSGGGYCSEARSFVQSLTSLGYNNFSIHQHGDSWNQNYISGQNEAENSLISRFDDTYRRRGPALINICHSEPGAWYVPTPRYHTFPCPDCSSNLGNKCYKIGRTMFETDSIPDGWVPRLNYMDEIWVPTEMSRDIFMKSGVPSEKLRVIGETVDTTFYSPKHNFEKLLKKKKYNLSRFQDLAKLNFNDTFIFLFVGKFEKRKGIELLIQAYFEEFSRNDKVMLLLLTSAYHSSNNFRNQIEEIISSKNLDKIREEANMDPPYLILTDIHQDAMPLLYSLADVLVIPSHGEGWGRPHMESMSCQTPVIATNWSGPTAFMNDENSFLVPITGLVDTP